MLKESAVVFRNICDYLHLSTAWFSWPLPAPMALAAAAIALACAQLAPEAAEAAARLARSRHCCLPLGSLHLEKLCAAAATLPPRAAAMQASQAALLPLDAGLSP